MTVSNLGSGTSDIFWPKINGTVPSYAQMGLLISALPGRAPVNIIDVKAVDYNSKVEMRFLHLTSSFPVGRFGRTTTAGGSIEFGIETHRSVVTTLAGLGLGGFTDVAFDVVVLYQLLPGASFLLDILHGCRLTGSEQRNTVGGKHLSTTCGLSISWIEWDTAAATAATVSGPSATSLSPVAPLHVGQ